MRNTTVAGSDRHAEALRRAYPDALTAECGGDGWGILTYADGPPESAKCPACAQENLVARVEAFLPPRFATPVDLPADAVAWMKRCADAAGGPVAGQAGIYFTGPVGTGKTHAAWHAVAGWCMATGTDPGQGVIVTRMTDLLDDLRPGDDSRQRVRDCQAVPLLVLDDVGAEKASEWTQERLYTIVDHRYAACLPLIVTSNLPPAALDTTTGERVASRFAEMCAVIPMTGSDRRKP